MPKKSSSKQQSQQRIGRIANAHGVGEPIYELNLVYFVTLLHYVHEVLFSEIFEGHSIGVWQRWQAVVTSSRCRQIFHLKMVQ